MRPLPPIAALVLVAALVAAAQFVPFGDSGSPEPDRRAKAAASGEYPTYGCDGALDVPDKDGERRAAEATLCLLNAERRRHDRPPFRSSGALTEAAGAHARDMVERTFFAHESPEGVNPAARIVKAGYQADAASGENIAYGTSVEGSPAAIVDGWMHSPGHRRNILRDAFAEIGVGVVARPIREGSSGGTYVTTFGGGT